MDKNKTIEAGEFIKKTRKLLSESHTGIIACENWVADVVAATFEACALLDEACSRLGAAEQEKVELKNSMTCLWCQKVMPKDPKGLIEHLLKCKNHPLARRIAELVAEIKLLEESIPSRALNYRKGKIKDLEAELASARKEIDRLKGTCVCMDCGEIIKTVEQSKHSRKCKSKP